MENMNPDRGGAARVALPGSMRGKTTSGDGGSREGSLRGSAHKPGAAA